MYIHRPKTAITNIVGIFLSLVTVCLLFVQIRTLPTKLPEAHDPPQRRQYDTEFPKKIWQVWLKYGEDTQDIKDENQRLSDSWKDLNPEYRYELLSTHSASTFVKDRFQHRPDILDVYGRTWDPILRADLIRYLALLAEGGVYSDMDTDCTKPIRDWIPAKWAGRTNLVIGIEYDDRRENAGKENGLPVQMCQWTLMSKPDHPAISQVVDSVVSKLGNLAPPNSTIGVRTTDDVMATTGPWIFTQAVLQAVSHQVRRPVSHHEISRLECPRLIGDVLFLPISSFASGQEHVGSKPWGNEDQLLSHHWSGFYGWKKHYESPPKGGPPKEGL